MNVVDSSAWLSYFAANANAKYFSKVIENLDQLIVPSIILIEVFKCIYRQCDEDAALEAIAHMQQGHVIPLDNAIALDAGYYGLQHKLPLADSIIYATAQKYDAITWTQDADFKLLSNVKYFKSVKR